MPRSQEEIRKDINYDESKVPAFELPSPLERPDGGRVTTAYEWVNRRRPEVLALYQKEVYGQIPPRPDRMWFETLSVREDALHRLHEPRASSPDVPSGVFHRHAVIRQPGNHIPFGYSRRGAGLPDLSHLLQGEAQQVHPRRDWQEGVR